MSTAGNPYYFRRRTMGRAASPPTWACYEQIHDDDCSNSDSDSCSEDDEDYPDPPRGKQPSVSDSEDNVQPTSSPTAPGGDGEHADIDHMDMDEEGADGESKEIQVDKPKDVKGKQRAIEPDPEPPRRQRKKRQRMYTLRPILTIQRSQGFVWNQDLFVPPYIKDRYIASTSPPNSRGFISSSLSSTNSAMTDYEVEVVEIRVKEGELFDIIP
ncbi:unnamed protein product [Cyclocybe aegerita]|uniref:Uncharacterized protein n=1 Tax=Cyclocybe aegerita TaxID=1973307 RepID=A0A8S0WPF9_CYCAE|nr:unnamed protein product [Cyclocybe aegerita]